MTRLILDRVRLYNLPLWLWAGLTDTVLLRVLGVSALDLASRRRGSMPDFGPWYACTRWKKVMADHAARGRAPSLSSVLARSNEFEVAPIQRAVMYCLVEFLLTRKKALGRLTATVAREGWRQDDEGEYPALTAAGWTLADLERDLSVFLKQ